MYMRAHNVIQKENYIDFHLDPVALYFMLHPEDETILPRALNKPSIDGVYRNLSSMQRAILFHNKLFIASSKLQNHFSTDLQGGTGAAKFISSPQLPYKQTTSRRWAIKNKELEMSGLIESNRFLRENFCIVT